MFQKNTPRFVICLRVKILKSCSVVLAVNPSLTLREFLLSL